MAKLENGFMGNAKGKLGSVVFSKWQGINTVRAHCPDVKDAKTPAQLTQRSKMRSLQNFLSPLNKNFIQLFNYKILKNSTPWATAISQNMPALKQNADIDLSKITFGNKALAAPKIISANYDPYIDLLTISYDRPTDLNYKHPFPLVVNAFLGISEPENDTFDFNTENGFCFSNPNVFTCFFPVNQEDEEFINYFGQGVFICIHVLDLGTDHEYYDNYGDIQASVPTPFIPTSIVANFNKNFTVDLIPADAVSLSYYEKTGIDYLQMDIDSMKVSPDLLSTDIVNITFVAITTTGLEYYTVANQNYNSFPARLVLNNPSNVISCIALWCVTDSAGTQKSKFSKKVHLQNIAGDKVTYETLLLEHYLASPISMKIEPTDSDVTGNLNVLLADFIQAFNSGYVTGSAETFDFANLEIKIFDPAGNNVTDATITSDGMFYSKGLTPSSDYYVTAIYDGELIDCWKKVRNGAFTNIAGGRYSPIPEVANKSFICPELVTWIAKTNGTTKAVLAALKPYRTNPNSWIIPIESYTQIALQKFQTNNPELYRKTILIDKLICLDASI